MPHGPPQAAWRSVAAVALLAVALVALAWWVVISLLGHELASAERDAQRQNDNLALAFSEHCLSVIRSVDRILDLSLLQQRRNEKIELLPLAPRDQFDPLMSVAITDAGGLMIAGSGTVDGRDFSERAFFAHHRDHQGSGLLISAPLQGRLSGRSVIPMSRRIEHAGGGFGGIVVAGIDPARFDEFYRKMELGRDGMVQLVGLDGATRARRTGNYKTSGQYTRASTLLKRQALADNGHFVSEGRQEGVRRYTSYRTLRDYGLIVAVGTSEEDVLGGYFARRTGYIAAASLFSLLAALFAALASMWMWRGRRYLDKTLRSEEQFRATFDQAAVGIAHVALDGELLKVNDTLVRLSGYPREELVGSRFVKFDDPRNPDEGDASDRLMRGLRAPVEGRYLRKDGTTLWATASPALVRDPKGRPDYFVAMVQDITEQKEAQAKVLHQAQFDLLTDLPNRALFADRLARALAQARRQKWSACVMFIDVDRFKAVNDTLGHAAGDDLLREIAVRLKASIRDADTAARVGGDEFAVVLAQLGKPEDAAMVARKILAAMAAPMLLAGREHVVTVSIGVAIFPDHGGDEESLVQHADAAMFEAKHAGRNAFRVYDPAATAHAA